MIDLRSQTPKGQRARAKILEAAEELLATRGFHGTSVRDIAGAAGLPLATVVYHFAKKEKLHGEILEAIGAELLGELDGVTGPADFATALLAWTARNPRRVTLLLRELLDNPPRVTRASRFPLAPFLERASALIAGPRVPNPELAVLHLVGAASYVVAAWPTVNRIVGRARAKQLAEAYEREAHELARRILGLDTLAPKRTPKGRPR